MQESGADKLLEVFGQIQRLPRGFQTGSSQPNAGTSDGGSQCVAFGIT